MERPILFSTPMVQAILDGRKTQTRRIVKPQPLQHFRKDDSVLIYERTPGNWEVKDKHSNDGFSRLDSFKCPYGTVGDVLWVRETWCEAVIDEDGTSEYFYKADFDDGSDIEAGLKYKPSIHMPKKACRIYLEITKIKIERLQNINESDADKEGVEFGRQTVVCMGFKNYLSNEFGLGASTASFKTLWQSINGEQSWESNPWVWVIEFKRINK